MGIRLAFQEQRGDAPLQGFNFHSLGGSGIGGKRCQLSDIALYAIGKLNLDSWSGLSAHDLSNLNAEIGECRSAVFGAPGSATSNSLGSQGFDLVIGAPILHRRDLATHLAHLRFQVAQHLEELPGLRPWQKRHWGAEYSRRPLYSPVLRSRQAMYLLTS
jgi:hypothetical protein